MKVDALLLVSDAQALTATAVSTNSIDTRSPATQNLEIGTGTPMGFGVAVDVAADFTTGDETYQFNVVSDDVNTLGSPTVIASYVRTAAQLTAGALMFLPLPQGFPLEQFIGIQYVLGGTTPTITVTAWFTAHDAFSKAYKAYNKGYTITG